MNKIKKISATVFTAVFFILSAFGFDWPQNETMSDSFYSYFGQIRGSTISTSLIFNDTSKIKSCDDGTILCIIEEPVGGFGIFDSTLGNAVIIEHENSIATVYGNLDCEDFNSELKDAVKINKGTVLGTSSNSGWQDGQSCLEFQVMDVKNKSAINPRLLMPRVGKELPLSIKSIILVDRDGQEHNLLYERRLKTGIYYVYRERQAIAVPYTTTTTLNGITQETIRYDSLKQNQGQLCAQGLSPYSVRAIYPDAKKHLIGQVKLTKGHNTLTLSVTNILGVTEQITYNLESY